MSTENENGRPCHKNGVFPVYNNGELSGIYIYDDDYRSFHQSSGKTSKQIFKNIKEIISDRFYLSQLRDILVDNEIRKRYKKIKKDVAKTKEMLNKDKDWYHRV